MISDSLAQLRAGRTPVILVKGISPSYSELSTKKKVKKVMILSKI